MKHCSFNRIIFASLLLIVLFPFTLVAQDATPVPDPLDVRSVGLWDTNGSVLYSVLLRSHQGMHGLTIASTLPEGATFVEAFWTPEAASFVGEENGVVTWTLPELAEETIVGPFTYRVKFEDAVTSLPYNVAADVTWDEGEAQASVSEAELPRYDDTGKITVDVAGTDGLVPVENTGVFINIPAGAYDQPMTFTFKQLSVDEQPNPPKVEEEIWWCTSFDVQVEPEGIVPNEVVTIMFPTRRTLTPGLAVSDFIQNPAGEWTTIDQTGQSGIKSLGKARRSNVAALSHLPVILEIVSPSGNQVATNYVSATHISTSQFNGGVQVDQRAASITSVKSVEKQLAILNSLKFNTSLDGTEIDPWLSG